MRILFLGDVVGPLGREGVKHYLSLHKKQDQIDLVIANGENATHGHGLSHKHYQELLNAGVDFITSGNHFYNNKDAFNEKYDFSKEIRPYNFDPQTPLKGTEVITINNIKIRITNLLGRVYMTQNPSNPFYALDEIIASSEEMIHIVDFHAEATAEKRCLAEYVDGRVTAVIGTHTHVQTNDAKYLPQGTFFLTDVGMNGAYDSILGDVKENSIRRTMTDLPALMDVPSKGKILTNGVLLDVDENSHKVISYKIINEISE